MLGWQRRDSERANRETTSGVQEYRPGFDALATRCSPRTALACNCGRVGLHRKKGMFGRLSFPRTETLTKTISDPAPPGFFPRARLVELSGDRRQKSFRDWLLLMTTMAMIIGMIPMALGLREGGEQNAPGPGGNGKAYVLSG